MKICCCFALLCFSDYESGGCFLFVLFVLAMSLAVKITLFLLSFCFLKWMECWSMVTSRWNPRLCDRNFNGYHWSSIEDCIDI